MAKKDKFEPMNTADEIREEMNERGFCLFLSEAAASRIAWILTAAIGLLTLPFLVLAIMTC